MRLSKDEGLTVTRTYHKDCRIVMVVDVVMMMDDDGQKQ